MSLHTVHTPWTVAYQASLSMGLSRQEYWSGLPFPAPGDLPDPGIEPSSPMAPALTGRFFIMEKPQNRAYFGLNCGIKALSLHY